MIFPLIGLKALLLWNGAYLFKEVKKEKMKIQTKLRQDFLLDQRYRMVSVGEKVILPVVS